MVVGRGGREVDLRAFGAPDPVRLLDADRLGPIDAVEGQQLVRVGRRAQVPLVQVALLDEGATAPAAPIRALDLFARECPVVGAPVHRRLRPIRESLLEEPQEHPLVPAVVGRVRRDHLGVPGEGRAHAPQLASHVLDVRHRPGERVTAVLDRRVLRGQSERVEADREEDVVAVHPPEAGHGVRRRLDVPVPDVQVARRIRVHRQQVVLGPGRVREIRLVQAQLRPLGLPARLDDGRVVALDPAAAIGGVSHGAGLGQVPHTLHPPPSARGDGRRWTHVLVELRGLEPRTPCMPCRCSPN